MTAKDLAIHAFNQTSYQISKVLEGISDADWDTKCTPESMSPRETVEHLSECCTAFLKHAKGEEHSWGTYTAPDRSATGLMAEFQKLRTESLGVLEGSHEPDTLTSAMDYLALHDAYHVGQLALLRMKLDSEWNAYGIYKSE